MQAATILDITMHPAGAAPNQMWRQVCRDVVGTFPTQSLRASLVSDVAVRSDLHHQCLSLPSYTRFCSQSPYLVIVLLTSSWLAGCFVDY